MQEAALPFRGTKDLDIVLCVEVLDKAFREAFWEFILAGNYKVQQRSSAILLNDDYYDLLHSGKKMVQGFSRCYGE
jgi:hypothetical protein